MSKYEGYVWIRKRKDDGEHSPVYDETNFKKKKKRWLIVNDSEVLYKHSPTSSDSKAIDLLNLVPLVGLNELDAPCVVYLIDSVERDIITALEPHDVSDTSILCQNISIASSQKRRKLMVCSILNDDRYVLSDTLSHCRDRKNILADPEFSEIGNALHLASQHGSSNCYSFLLATMGVDALKLQNKEGLLCIHIAARGNNIPFFRDLLQISNSAGAPHKVHISMIDSYGRTPLHVCRDEEIVAIMIGNGADIEAQDAQGNTPLMLACERGDFLVAVELLDADAVLNKANWATGMTPLMRACRSKNDELLEELMDRGADVGCLDNNRCSALHHACMSGYVLGCVTLLNSGVDTDIQDIYGATAMCYACGVTNVTQSAAREIVALLLARGSYARIRDFGGRQALHYAAESGSCSAVQVLLSQGSEVNAVDHRGETALEIVENKLEMLKMGVMNSAMESPVKVGLLGTGGGAGDDDTLRNSRISESVRFSIDTIDSSSAILLDDNVQEMITFASQLRLQGLRATEKSIDAEKWKSYYIECQSLLLANGAVKRAIKSVPVEQDCRDITFSYKKNGTYHVATATPWALVNRLTTFPYFTSLHASNLLATYRLYLSPMCLLKLLQLRYYALHGMHQQAVALTVEDCEVFASLGVFFIEEEQVVYRLKMLEQVTRRADNVGEGGGSNRPVSIKIAAASAPGSSNGVGKPSSEGPMQFVMGIDSHVIRDYSGSRDDEAALPGTKPNDQIIFRNVYVGKISSFSPDSLVERLMHAVNVCCNGVELFRDCMLLLIRKRYVKIGCIHVHRETVNDNTWTLNIFNAKHQSGRDNSASVDAALTDGGEAATEVVYPAMPEEAFSLSSLEVSCKPGHRLMRGKVVVELRAQFINEIGKPSALTSMAYLSDHYQNEMCETFAAVLSVFVQGQDRVKLVPVEERFKLIASHPSAKSHSHNDIEYYNPNGQTVSSSNFKQSGQAQKGVISRSASFEERQTLHSFESEMKHHASLPSVFHGMRTVERKASTESLIPSTTTSPSHSKRGFASARQSEASESNRSSGSAHGTSSVASSPMRASVSERDGSLASVTIRNEANVASLRGCVQLLSTWCTDFYEDDFERDAVLKVAMGRFIEEVMEHSGELIEEEFDPNVFTPFITFVADESRVLELNDATACEDSVTSVTDATSTLTISSIRKSVVVSRTSLACGGEEQRASVFSKRMSKKSFAPLKKRGTSLFDVFTPISEGIDDLQSFDETIKGQEGTVDVPLVYNLLELRPEDVAEQLTLMEHTLFCRIKRSELIDSKQVQYNHLKELQAFTVHAMDWMISAVVSSRNCDEASRKIAFLLRVSSHMQKIRNYNGMFEVLTALETTSVYRLKSAWSKLDAEANAQHATLKALFSSRAGFQAFRKFIVGENCQPPCMPYLGLYLKDIIYILQLPSYVSPGIVNVTKMGSLACKVMEIHSYQTTPYHFLSQPQMIQVLKSPPQFITEDAQYQASIDLEPILTNRASSVS